MKIGDLENSLKSRSIVAMTYKGAQLVSAGEGQPGKWDAVKPPKIEGVTNTEKSSGRLLDILA